MRDSQQVLRLTTTSLTLSLPQKLSRLPWGLLFDPEQVGDDDLLSCYLPFVRLVPDSSCAPFTPLFRRCVF